jgi:glycosyltransferase involved in cell wall biosynthesis
VNREADAGGGESRAFQVTAILTAHNRRELTLACLRSYFSQDAPGTVLRAVLVDDGSSDGTADAVLSAFPAAEVICATGDLFWARGMATAEARAVQTCPDFLLWLNDDVVLYPDALRRLLSAAEVCGQRPVVVAGAVCDPETGATTYGGLRRRDWHPMRFALVEPGVAPAAVDTVHGNVLLVPRVTYRLLGGIDGHFAHSYADCDYGLRLRQAGGQNLLSSGRVGTCAPNDIMTVNLSLALPLSVRWRFFHSRKGRPLGSQARYLRRHGGPFWPFFLLPPYVRLLIGRAPPDISREGARLDPEAASR